MSVTYAGVPLLTPTETALDKVRRLIDPADFVPWSKNETGKNRRHWTIAGGVTNRPVKVGTLYWPTGASRWAVGYFLASGNQLAQIRRQVYAGGSYSSQPLVLSDGKRSLATNLWMLTPRPVGAVPKFNGIYLLVLVDDRYFWWQKTPGYVSVTPGTTFQSLLTSVASYSGLYISQDQVASPYQYASPSLTQRYEDLPPLLDTIAYNCGQRLVRGLDGSVKLWNYASSSAQVQSNSYVSRPVQAGGSLAVTPSAGADAAPILPQAVQVAFVYESNQAPTTQVQNVSVTLASLTPSGQSLSSLAGMITNTSTKTFREAAAADFTNGSWNNQTECQNLTTQIAVDWYQYQTASLDIVFAGVHNWTPEGLSDSIEWIYRQNEVHTRVQRPPLNDVVEELLHSTVLGTRGTDPLTTNSLLVRYTDNSLNIPTTQTISLDPASFTLTQPDANNPNEAVLTAVPAAGGWTPCGGSVGIDLSGNVTYNDYTIGDICLVLVTATNAPNGTTLTGIKPYKTTQTIRLLNIGLLPLILPHLSSSSQPNNRFNWPLGFPLTLWPGDGINLVRDALNGLWRAANPLHAIANADGSNLVHLDRLINASNDQGTGYQFGRIENVDNRNGSANLHWQGTRITTDGTTFLGPYPDTWFVAGTGISLTGTVDAAKKVDKLTISTSGYNGNFTFVNCISFNSSTCTFTFDCSQATIVNGLITGVTPVTCPTTC